MQKVWDSSSSKEAAPRSFSYLLFPKQGTLPALDRAVICSQEELTSGDGSFSFFDEKNVEQKIPFSDLTAQPEAASLIRHIQNLNRTLQQWGDETDWKTIRFELTSGKNGNSIGTLYMGLKKGDTLRFDYSIENGQPKALQKWISRRY